VACQPGRVACRGEASDGTGVHALIGWAIGVGLAFAALGAAGAFTIPSPAPRVALAPVAPEAWAANRRITGGAVKLGPGAIYTTIKRLLADGLIEESDERPDPDLDDQRRRYYRLTALGRSVAAAVTGEVLRDGDHAAGAAVVHAAHIRAPEDADPRRVATERTNADIAAPAGARVVEHVDNRTEQHVDSGG